MKLYLRDITAEATWKSLAELIAGVGTPDTYIGFKGFITAHQSNGSDLDIRLGTDATTQSTLAPAEYFEVHGSNIANIQIQGVGLVLKLAGNTNSGW